MPVRRRLPRDALQSGFAGAPPRRYLPAGHAPLAYPILAKALSQTTRGRIINVGDTGEQDLLATIAGLGNAINNTSLIFTLEVGDDVLLLPGDSQWGPWQAILGNADTVALINRTTFYKVSHHGSYNGTPKSLVAKLDRKITAGISVNRVTQWPNIPERALVNQLKLMFN